MVVTAVVDFVRTIPATKVDAAIVAAKFLANQDETVRRIRTVKRVESAGPGLVKVTLAVEVDS